MRTPARTRRGSLGFRLRWYRRSLRWRRPRSLLLDRADYRAGRWARARRLTPAAAAASAYEFNCCWYGAENPGLCPHPESVSSRRLLNFSGALQFWPYSSPSGGDSKRILVLRG